MTATTNRIETAIAATADAILEYLRRDSAGEAQPANACIGIWGGEIQLGSRLSHPAAVIQDEQVLIAWAESYPLDGESDPATHRAEIIALLRSEHAADIAEVFATAAQ